MFQIAMKKTPAYLLAALVLLIMAAAARTEARAPDPGEPALLWSISRDGVAAGYLLGTIHSEDPRVLDFPEPFIDQLAANQVFAMEMVPGEDLAQRLERGPLPVDEAIDVCRQIAEGLEAAHEAGLAVYVYTVDDPARMDELFGFGVDGVFTNLPDVGRTRVPAA